MMWWSTMGTRLILTLSAIQATVLVSARVINSDAPDDPLARFTGIQPGQSMDDADLTWCSSYREYYGQYWPEDLTRVCHVVADGGVVQSVTIYARDGIIQWLSYSMEGLTIGDLALLWGRPVIEREAVSHYRYVHWDRSAYTLSVPLGNRRFSYWLPVESLIVSEP